MQRFLKSLFNRPQKPLLPVPAPEKLHRACHAILHGEKRDFQVAVGRSRIIGAGYGLVVKQGRIRAGDIVALYSGHYYPPPPNWSLAAPDGESALKVPQVVRELPPGILTDDPEAYQIHCNNVGGHIDGLLFSLESAIGQITNLSASTSAQLVNHPPRGILPNVFSHSFAWPAYIQHVLSDSGDRGTGGNSGGQKAVTTESASASASAGAGNSGRGNAIARVEAEEQALIDKVNPMGSGIWFYDPWTAQAVDLYPDCAPRAGLAAVATRDIEEGEELFMDYKYHPNNRPAWYVPVDYPEEQ